MFSKRVVAKTTINDEENTNMLPSTSKATNQQNAHSHCFTQEPTKTVKAKEGAKTKKTTDTKKGNRFLPKEFHRLENWKSLAEESSDDEEN